MERGDEGRTMKLKMLDLFSGIGGFSLAAHWTGQIETVAFCEIEPYPQKVLQKHWPDVPIFEDVRTLKGEDVGPVDIICGGYPCQPFSLAGKRAGAEDDRHLWPEVHRLLQELRPTWFLGENVAGHISLGLDQALSDLEGIGYTGQPFVVPACAKDAPHRRDRVWIVAHAQSLGRVRAGAVQEQQRGTAVKCSSEAFSKRESSEHGRASQKTINIFTPDTYSNGRNERRERFCATRSNGIIGDAWWKTEPGVARVAYGVPSRVDRIKALGNSIVPQVAYEIFTAMLAAN